MLLSKVIAAYRAAVKLMNTEMPYQTAHAILTLKTRLEPHAAFFAQKERELVEEFGKKENGRVAIAADGRFELKDDASAAAFLQKRRELDAVELQENFGLLTAKAPESITPAQLEALQGFIVFEEG